ncbi:hypothetical protein COP1_021548 [Malus domestica]
MKLRQIPSKHYVSLIEISARKGKKQSLPPSHPSLHSKTNQQPPSAPSKLKNPPRVNHPEASTLHTHTSEYKTFLCHLHKKVLNRSKNFKTFQKYSEKISVKVIYHHIPLFRQNKKFDPFRLFPLFSLGGKTLPTPKPPAFQRAEQIRVFANAQASLTAIFLSADSLFGYRLVTGIAAAASGVLYSGLILAQVQMVE